MAPVFSIVKDVFLFILAGLCEIGGGWCIWQTMREARPWWWMAIGILLCALYGVVPTFQDADDFGRIFAVYGGFFILLSLLWGWALDKKRPDLGDTIGCIVAMVGVLIMFYYPRDSQRQESEQHSTAKETTQLLP